MAVGMAFDARLDATVSTRPLLDLKATASTFNSSDASPEVVADAASNVAGSLAMDTVAAPQQQVPSGSTTTSAEYAYAYVIGGCSPENPAYVYYFYDIMINTYLQRQEGSQADVVILVQMSFASTHSELREEDMRLLNAMNIKVQYIPKAADESFYRIMLDKFLTLGLTQYKRVLFLDGDGTLQKLRCLHVNDLSYSIHHNIAHTNFSEYYFSLLV